MLLKYNKNKKNKFVFFCSIKKKIICISKTFSSKHKTLLGLINVFPYFFIFCSVILLLSLSKTTALSDPDTTPPHIPQNLKVTTYPEKAELNWKDNLEWDIFSYVVFLRNANEDKATPIFTGRRDNYTIENLVIGDEYYISLAAKDIAGNLSKVTKEIGFTVPSQASDNYSINGWMPVSWDQNDAESSFINNKDLFTTISPFMYDANSDGTLSKKSGLSTEFINTANNNNVKIIPTITNNYDKDEKISNLLKDRIQTEKHLQNILKEIDSNNFDGIDIDYENLTAASKDSYTIFLKNLAAELHNRNKTLSVTVQAKRSDSDNWNGVGSLDFSEIGKFADQVRLMTYDFSRPSTIPGPVAPVNWIADSVNYAKKHIPAKKIIVGIPFYGYDWCTKKVDEDSCENSAVVWNGVQNIIKKYSPQVEWDSKAGSPWFLYEDEQGNTNVIHYEDHRSIEAKINLVKEKQVGGISIWRLGSEDPQNFDTIKNNLNKSLSAPQNISITPKDEQIELSWNHPPNFSTNSYLIKYSLKNEFPRTIKVTDTENYTLSDLSNNEPYYITIKSISSNSSTEESFTDDIYDPSQSKTYLATPEDTIYPKEISDLRIDDIKSTSIKLSWTNSGDNYTTGIASKIDLRHSNTEITEENFFKAKKYPFTPSPDTPGDKTSWEVRDIPSGQTHYIAIRTLDENGNYSPISNIVSAKTIDNIPPASPEGFKAYPGNEQVNLVWQPNNESDLEGFKIYYKQEDSYYNTESLPKNTHTHTIEGLENNYEYSFKLSSFDMTGNESFPTEDVLVTPVAGNIPGKISGQIAYSTEKLKGSLLIFGKKIISDKYLPYVIFIAIIIINIFTYFVLKEEIKKAVLRKMKVKQTPSVTPKPHSTNTHPHRTIMRF